MRRAPRGSHRAPIIGRSSEGSPSRCSPAFSKRRAKQRKQAGQRAALFRRRPNHLTRDQCRRTKPAYALVRLIRLAHKAARSGVPASATASGPPPGRGLARIGKMRPTHGERETWKAPRGDRDSGAVRRRWREAVLSRRPAFGPKGIGKAPARVRPQPVRGTREATWSATPPKRARRRPNPAEKAASSLIRRTARLAVRAVHRRPIHSMPRRPEIRRRPDEERRCAPRPVRSPPRYHWYETPAPYVLP